MMEISVQVPWGGEFAWSSALGSGFGICGGRFRGLLSLVRGEGSHLEATRHFVGATGFRVLGLYV